MYIQDVDFPGTLVEAQKNGTLVIFAGAGVSIPPPANYPNFNNLANEVAKGSLTRADNEPVDRFLGRLVARNVPVHEIVRQKLSDPNSAHNSLHTNLLRLFQSEISLKVVTTNFDLHFNSAVLPLFHRKELFETFSAPALPMGNNFNGLVYLHGSVDKPANRLVLTDADFGRAYLTEGWARRFLQELFSHYVVLFIGYSHSDPVMNYLARGLPPESTGPRRFALTHKKDAEDWKFRGVHPIIYPVSAGENKHETLGSTIAGWADRVEMDVLEQEEMLKQIVELPVTLNVESLDIVLEALKHAPGARFFTRHCNRPDWLRWLESKGLLKPLFTPDAVLGEIDKELASWFAERFVCDHAGDALSVMHRQGKLINEVLWRAITFQLFRTKDPRPEPKIFGQWLPILMNHVPQRGTGNLFDFILSQSNSPKNDSVAILLFEHLARPRIELKKDIWREISEREEDGVSVEIVCEGREYWLTESWKSIFRPRLPEFSDRLIWIITSHLQYAFLLLDSWGGIHQRWDILNAHRDRIEGSRNIRDGIDVLVDAAREVLDLYLETAPQKADSLIQMWILLEPRLLKRLAIYGAAKNKHWNSKEKIDWLLKHDLLYTFNHEVFQVLEAAYASVSIESREVLLKHALEAHVLSDEADHRTSQIFNLLNWLCKVAPDCPLTQETLKTFKDTHPQFISRDQPDLDDEIDELTIIEDKSPISAEILLNKSPKAQVEFLLSFQGKSFIGPNRTGMLGAVESAVAISFEWGQDLVDALIMPNGILHTDLWQSILAGWNLRDLSDTEWGTVLKCLSDNPEIFSIAEYNSANFLENGVKKETNAIPEQHLWLAFEVSQKLWTAISKADNKSPSEPEDWFSFAVSNPAGILTHFWLHLISRLRKYDAEAWKGLPPQLRVLFDSILADGSTIAREPVRVIMASQLNFLFASDKDWTNKNVVPLLDWSKYSKSAIACWQGYLVAAAWPGNLLPSLLPLYEQLFPVIEGQLDSMQERFCYHLAAAACFGSINPLEHGWLSRFLEIISERLRLRWASDVQMMLRQMENDSTGIAWKTWIEQYWQNRINGIPLALTPIEAGEMTEWCLYLEPVFPVVVDKICSGPSPLLENSFLYYELPDTALPDSYPASVAKLILFLLQKSTAPIYDFDRLDQFHKAGRSKN